MKHYITYCLLTLGIALTPGLTAFGVGTSLPYSDEFEAYSPGDLPVSGSWSKYGAGTATIQTNNYLLGVQSLSVSNASVVLSIDTSAGVYTNAVWRWYAKPSMYDDENGTEPPPVTNGSYGGIFYMTTSGAVRAFVGMGSSNGWTNASGSVLGPTNSWIGFEVRLRYASSNWDLYWTSNGYDSAMSKVNSSPMPFLVGSSYTELTSVTVTNDAYVDAWFVGEYWAGGGIRLPFFDGFESYTLYQQLPTGQGVWTMSGTDPSAVITNTPVAELAKACALQSGALVLPIDQGQGYTNVWCHFFSIPSPYDDEGGTARPPVESNAVAQTYVSTGGVMYAYVSFGSSNWWTNLVNVSTGSWLGMAMHIDYRTRKWDLYVTSNGYGSVYSKVNPYPMAFQSDAFAVTKLADLTIQDGSAVDAVALAVASGSPTSGSPSKMIMEYFPERGTNMVSLLAHHYGSGSDTLAGRLGLDLLSGLRGGDKLRLFYTNDWNKYLVQSGRWTVPVSYPSIAPSNMVVSAGMGMWIERTSATNTAAFFAYDTLPSFTNTVYGTNNIQMGGWNLLGWPYTTSQSATNGWGFASIAGPGDRIYIYDSGAYVRLWWDDTVKRWRQNAALSSYMLRGGQAFWYYRAGTTVQWSVSSPP